MSVIPAQRTGSDRVTVIGDALEIHLRITHPETVALARREVDEHGPAGLISTVATAVTVGMIATSLQGGAGNASAAMTRALTGFEEAMHARAVSATAQLDSLIGRIDATEAATRQAAAETLAALPTRIEQGLTTALAGGSRNVQEVVRQAATSALNDAQAQLARVVGAHTAEVRSVISTENPNSPIAALQRDLNTTITTTVENTRRELAEGLAAVRALVQAGQAQAAARDKSSARGKEFEETIAEIVGNWSVGSGDSVEHVGTQPAPGTSRKTGDVVIRLNTPGAHQPTIAIEAKRRAKALTARQHREELGEAMRIRRAQAAIGVVPTPDQVPGPGRFHRVDANAFVVSADDPEMFVMVLAVVKELTLLTTAQSDADPAVDLGRARTAIAGGIQLLSRLDEVTKYTGNAERALVGIRSTADALRAAMTGQLQEAARALRPNTDSA
ncbi:MAG: hypothetical protein JWO98_1705 [Frankiales bacterium]|nr:hypothetical protein [Frankiales bacterium]